VYLSAHGHIHELYFRLSGGSRWAQNDLTTLAGALPALAGSALSSWVDAKYQHVAYLSSDAHVHELYLRLSGGRWAQNDLTATARAPAALLGTTLTSWVNATSQHMAYLAPDGHVREVYFRFAGGGWRANDVTAAAHAPLALLGTTMSSWVDANYQRVAYFAVDGHVHQLYFRYSGTRWSNQDLHMSALAAASLRSARPAP
jgi:hypothetical protein